MGEAHRHYIPAAGHDWLLPLYDPIQKLLGGDAARRELIAQAGLQAGQRVLDIGCGTGELVVLIARLHPGVEVVGLDPDPRALARARRKAERAAAAIPLDTGFADALPYADASFDRVFSSFMLHHLESAEKTRALGEVRRVLRPGGSLHLVDFAPAESGSSRGLVARLLHSAEPMREQRGSRIAALLEEAGLAEASERGDRHTLFGRIAFFRASAPGARSA
jgi:ubiquinone/menaquinone biosynthesis C-methylase UbiE